MGFGVARQRLSFLCFAKEKTSKRKGDPQSGPCASLRVPCGAQTQWGHVQTRLRLKQARALIRWVLRSSAQPERGFCLARTVVFTLNANFNGQASFITSQEPWQEVPVNAVDVMARATVTMKKIAASAVSTRAGGRFGLEALEAGNDGVWGVEA